MSFKEFHLFWYVIDCLTFLMYGCELDPCEEIKNFGFLKYFLELL
jgi:hypothetical protein